MNIFLLGGWVARPSAFYFCACAGSLSYSVRSAYRVRLARFYVKPNRTLLALPVPSIPSISALLGSYLTLNENTPCIFMYFLLTLLHSYAMFN